jgi:hypothetical protein
VRTTANACQWEEGSFWSTENEGKVDQVEANLKDAGEKVKDAFKS